MQSEIDFYAEALQSLHSSYSHKKRDAILNYISSNTIEYTIVSLGLVIILPSITLVSTCHSFLILIGSVSLLRDNYNKKITIP